MKKVWKLFCVSLLCAALIMPCIQASAAVTINRKGTTSGTKDTGTTTTTTKDTDEKEYLDVETTITETEKEEKDTTTTTGSKEVIAPADIVFVIDSTGSMWSFINNVAKNVESFSKYLEDEGIDVRMAVVEYRDITYDGEDSTIIHAVDGTPWHSTTTELVSTLNIIKAGVDGGGDEPETVIDALGYVADGTSLKFRSDAHKFAIILTDASYKEDNTHGLTTESLVTKLQAEKINVSVVTETGHYAQYAALVGETGMNVDIRSSDFYEALKELAKQIVEIIEEEEKLETVKSVKSVTVSSKGTGKIVVGNSVNLNAVIKPDDAESKTVSWLVEDDTIASIKVSADTKTCKVTAQKIGKTKVIAVTEDGGFTGDFDITVIGKEAAAEEKDEDDGDDGDDGETAIPVTVDDMVISPAKKTIAKGSYFKVKVKTSDEVKESASSQEELDEWLDESIDSITYRSSKSSVAYVNTKGTVKGKKAGSAIIYTTVNAADGTSKTFRTKVYVTK